MLRDELLQDDEIKNFVKNGDFSEVALIGFLEEHVLHPDHHVKFMNQVARNVVVLSAPKFGELSRPKRFFLLKAIVKLMDSAMWLKIWEYNLSRPDAAEYWKGLPLPFFTPLSGMIEPLESMRWALQRIEPIYVGSGRLLLVEGESEAVFVQAVQWLTRASNFDVKVYAYGGRGAVQSLVHLIKDKNAAGVGVYLSYDKDGKADDLVRTLRNRGCRISRSFAFPRDFESAFPPRMLATAVNRYAERVAKVPLRVTVDAVNALLQDKKPFSIALKASYGLEAVRGEAAGHRPFTEAEKDQIAAEVVAAPARESAAPRAAGQERFGFGDADELRAAARARQRVELGVRPPPPDQVAKSRTVHRGGLRTWLR